MFGTYKTRSGFTLMEIMVALLILGLIATIVVPVFRGRGPKFKRQEFVDEINSLIQFAVQDSMATQKSHRVLLDNEKKLARVEKAEPKKIGESSFVPVANEYYKTAYEWPDSIDIKDVFIDGSRPLEHGREFKKFWFFVTPDGTAQEVIINALDVQEEGEEEKNIELGLVLNPFSAKLKKYDTFQKP